jgi:adenylate cyclase
MSLAVAVGIIAFMLRHAFAPARAGNLASIEKMAFPLPDVPSIVVLPFVNMSEDPKQEFFCDGITQSIITALLKVPGLFVISPPTTFSYKGKQVKVKQVSEELGVRYVLEGSVQRSADRIRINAHLIDALTGRPIWAERYDGDLKDLFALQDEITMKILTATQVKLTEGEQAVTVATYYKGKQGLDCYLKYYEGTGYLRRGTIQDDNVARRIGDEVIAMCPQNPMGYFLLGLVHLQEYRLSNTKSPRETLEKGIELAQKMLALDDSIAAGHALLSYFYSMKGEHEKAIAEGERAVSLNPGAALANGAYANSLYHAGRPGEAIPFFQKAARLCPVTGSTLHVPIGNALMHTERFEEAVSEYKKAIRLSPDNILAHVGLAGTYSMMSQEKEAHAEATEVLRINPKFSVDYFAKTLSYKDQSKKDKTISALRKAGLK